jgi:ATP-binding cassette subfamily B protein
MNSVNQAEQAVRQEHTQHVTFAFAAGSYAEQLVDSLGERAEVAYRRCWEWFGRDDAASPQVYIALVDAAPEGVGDVLVVSPEEPGLDLEWFVMRSILSNAAPGVDSTQLILRALAEYLAALSGADGTVVEADQLAYQRLVGESAPAWPTLAAASYARVSLMGYLERAFGSIAVRRLARAALTAPPGEALSTTFGRSVDVLMREWTAELRKRNRTATMGLDFLRHLWPLMRPYWRYQLELGFYMVLDLIAGLAMPLATKVLFDSILPTQNLQLLAVWLVAVPAFFLLGAGASYRRVVVAGLVGELVQLDVMRRAFGHLQSLSLSFHTRSRVGDLLTRVTSDVGDVQTVVGETLPGLVFNLATLVVSAAVLIALNWFVGLIVLILGIPVFAVIYRRTSRGLQVAARDLQDTFGATTAFLTENLGSQLLVKSFSLEARSQRTFEALLLDTFRNSMRTIRLEAVLRGSTDLIYYGIRVLVLAGGAVLVISGRMSVGDLVAVLWLIAAVLQPVIAMTSQFRRMLSATGAFDRVRELLDEVPAVIEDPAAVELAAPVHEIRLDGVTLRYGDGAPALANISLTIPVGQHIALVGPSGSGKSSVVGLLLRLYDPQYGRVLIDGRDAREATLASLRGQFGLVPQDTYLFDASIGDNIALAREGLGQADVERAARAAEVHETILQTEHGYDTRVGERGVRLSGGQRQRVAIARALVRDPAVLVMDEATSALDPQTEAAILRTLDRTTQGRTRVVITHRLSAAIRADRIYVLDRGRLIEEGTHKDLLAAGGLYARLFTEQQRVPTEAPPGVDPTRLSGVPLFASLSPSALAAVASCVKVESFPAGVAVVRQRDPADRLYVIASGQVEVLRTDPRDPSGLPRRVRALGEGSFFGEIALLGAGDDRRTATVRTLVASELYSLERDDFQALLQVEPRLADTVRVHARSRLEAMRRFHNPITT